jgi:hypothetical protein
VFLDIPDFEQRRRWRLRRHREDDIAVIDGLTISDGGVRVKRALLNSNG